MKWTKISQDNLRIGTAKALARFMSCAQITCFTRPSSCMDPTRTKCTILMNTALNEDHNN